MLISGLLLAACGNGVSVSPAAATAASTGTPSTPPATPAPPATPSPPATPAPPPAAPVQLTGTPAASVTAGQNYSFQPTVAQGAGTVTFSVQGLPAWAAFDASTGALTGTPAVANEGTTGAITITGSNGSSSASIGPFTILVNAPPATATGSATLTWTAPTENTDGTPITGLAGYHIYYGPTASNLTTTITVTDATETTYVVTGLAPGTYYFAVVAYNTAGADSPESNVASKTI